MDGMTASQTVSSPCSPVRRDETKPHGVTVGYLEGRGEGGACNVGHARASFVGATLTHTHTTHTTHTLEGLLFSLGLRCDPVPTSQPILLPNSRSDIAPTRRQRRKHGRDDSGNKKQDDEIDAGPPSLSCGDAKPSTALYAFFSPCSSAAQGHRAWAWTSCKKKKKKLLSHVVSLLCPGVS